MMRIRTRNVDLRLSALVGLTLTLGAGVAVASPAPKGEASPKPSAQAPAPEEASAEPSAKSSGALAQAAAGAKAEEDKGEGGAAPVGAKTDVKKGESRTGLKKAKDTQATQNPAFAGGTGTKQYFLLANMQFRTLAITDDDPANGRSLLYSARAGYTFLKGSLQVFGQIGATQNFTAEEGETGFLFQDVQASAIYMHSVDLKALSIPRKLQLMYLARLFFPTSRASRNQDLYLGTRAAVVARINVLGGLFFRMTGIFDYRFHQFAEREGPGAPLNTQLVAGGAWALDYILMQSSRFGVLLVGADLWTTNAKTYASVDGEFSWRPRFGWDAYVSYSPLAYLTVGVSLEQGARVLRNGIVNIDAGNRDTTEVALTLTGRY